MLLSCAGPFALIGDAVVAACVRSRTDYCDITGEYPWVRALIDRHHAEAAANGILIVNSGGFDSIPSDLGALHAVTAARQRHGGGRAAAVTIGDMDALLSAQGGGASGGTVASISNMLATTSLAQFRASQDPFFLDPPRATAGKRVPTAHDADLTLPVYLADMRCWTAPYMMAPGNTRAVRRSAALLDFGERFSYREGCARLFFALLLLQLSRSCSCQNF